MSSEDNGLRSDWGVGPEYGIGGSDQSIWGQVIDVYLLIDPLHVYSAA